MPGEVRKVGVALPTFIEPVQKHKDGIEAMFMRQAKAKESASTAAVAGRTGNKRKHKPSSSSPTEVKDETGTPVTLPSLAKCIKPDKSGTT